MKKRNTFLLFAVAAVLCDVPAANAQTAFTYQGKLTDDCCPATGYYDLTFKVFDNAGPGATGQQGSSVALTRVPVTNGLFTVSLDFGSSVFTGARRWLQIDARTNNAALTAVTLLPRTELTATPYALYAQKAAMVPNGSVTPAMISSSGASQDQVLTFNGSSVTWANSPASPWSVAAPNIYYNSGNVGIGTPGPLEKLHIANGQLLLTASSASADPGDGAGPAIRMGYSSSDFGYINANVTGIAPRNLILQQNGGSVGIGTPNPHPDSVLELSSARHTYLTLDKVDPGYEAGIRIRTGESWRWWAFADNDTDDFKILGANETDAAPRIQLPLANNNVLLGLSGGNVGIGTASPGALLTLAQEAIYSYPRPGSSAKGAINVRMPTVGRSTGLTFSGGGRDDAQAGIYVYQDNAAGTTMHFATTDSYATGPQARMTISNTGGVGIGTQSPAFPLTVRTAPGYGIIHTDGTREVGTYVDGSGGWLGTRSNHPLNLFVNDGGAALRIDTDNTVSLQVLTITGGADIAEPFPMSTEEIPKGAVVTIDEDHPGQLKMSERAYDTRVAGIISGANGIKPGVSLHQQGALEGTDNVALSGRVYALANASEAPIKPGDLLTTSAMPGHCMKVTDPAKAQGAIIGKAMSALAEGKGMVLVLVSLQ